MTSEQPSRDPSRDETKDEAILDARIKRRLAQLSLGTRIVLFLVGWSLVLIGVAGLVLPGIQGILTILAGAAVLSLVSELAYKWTKAGLKRWPRLWDKVEQFRDRIHRWLAKETDP